VGFKAAEFRGDIVVYQPLGGGFEDRISILAPLFWPGTPQSHAAVGERALARQRFDRSSSSRRSPKSPACMSHPA